MNIFSLSIKPNLFNKPTSCSKPIAIKSISDSSQIHRFKEIIDNLYTNNSNQCIGDIIKESSAQFKCFSIYKIFDLTVKNTCIHINYSNIKSCIKITEGSKLFSSYSMFFTFEKSVSDCGIEISENSHGSFKSCHFNKAKKISIILKGNSTATFDHCTFDNNNVSCYLQNKSKAEFIDCKFANDHDISILGKDLCEIIINNCQFKNINGKAIYCYEKSKIYVNETLFDSCKKSVVSIIDESQLYITDSNVKKSNDFSFHISENSFMEATNLKIEKSFKSSIFINNSASYFSNCQIGNTNSPCLIVQGEKSNPIFQKTTFSVDKFTFSVSCQKNCRPIFYDCIFYGAILFSTFSDSHIEKCKFINDDKKYIKIQDHSTVTHFNIKYDEQEIDVCPSSTFKLFELEQIQKVTNDFFNEALLMPLPLKMKEEREIKKIFDKYDEFYKLLSNLITINFCIRTWFIKNKNNIISFEYFMEKFYTISSIIIKDYDISLACLVLNIWHDDYIEQRGKNDNERIYLIDEVKSAIQYNNLNYRKVILLEYQVLHDYAFACLTEHYDLNENELTLLRDNSTEEDQYLLSNCIYIGDTENSYAKMNDELLG